MTSPPTTSSDIVNNGSKASGKRKASAVCPFHSLHIGKSGTHFVRDVTFSGCSAPSWHRPLLLELKRETEVSHSVTAIGLSSDARQDVHRRAAERLALMGRAVSVSQPLSGLHQPKPASRMLSKKRLRRWCPHPPGHIRPRWLRHLVRAGLPQQLRCGYRRCCSSAWFGGCLSLCCY